ncbi:hypothetical protein BDN72DRAFT_847616, partial [Pluteus cervinus]
PHPLLTQQFDTSEVAFAKIDKEITALREGIRALHAFRNTFTPVYRLPPEVLTRIFYFVRQVHKRERFHRRNLKWVIVTHVSQHWRNAAIGCPALWSHISSIYPMVVAQELLHRSKAAPLSLELRSGSALEARQLVSTSLSRIRELRLDLYSAAWEDLSPDLSSPAFLLESFSLVVLGKDVPSPASALSDITFAGTTPRLRRLEVAGCSVDIHSPIFTDLTSLELRNPPQKLSAIDLLVTLRNLPGLTSLSLSSVLDRNASAVSSDFNIIILASLKSLSINGPPFIPNLDILSHLSFPANTTLQFHSRVNTAELAVRLSDFLRVHHAARLPESSPTLTNIIKLHDSWFALSLRIMVESTESELVNFELTMPHTRLDSALELSDSPETATLFSYLPLPSVTLFTTNCGIGIGTWTNTFGPLSNLKRISASGTHANNLISAVINDFQTRCPAANKKKNQEKAKRKRSPGKGSKSGGRQKVQSTSNLLSADWEPIFPNLETINLEETDFLNSADFVAALHGRKIAGKNMKLLDIAECRNVDRGVIDALGGCVENVEWDQWIGTNGNYDDDDDSTSDDDGY